MKKNTSILIIVFCALIIFSLILLAEEVKYAFRKTTWGMNQKQVKATEDQEPDYESDTNSGWALGYEIKIDGEDYYCFYYFVEDKLWMSIYMFAEEHTNENAYIDDYKKLKEILTKKYGKPNNDILETANKDEIQWKDDLYKDDKSEWGFAISVGDLEYISAWETPITKIFLNLSGDNYKIRLIIGYSSKELKEWASKILEEKIKNEF